VFCIRAIQYSICTRATSHRVLEPHLNQILDNNYYYYYSTIPSHASLSLFWSKQQPSSILDTYLDPQKGQVLYAIAFEFDFVCGKIQDAHYKSNPCVLNSTIQLLDNTVPRRKNARQSTSCTLPGTLLYAIAFEFEFVYLSVAPNLYLIYNKVLHTAGD